MKSKLKATTLSWTFLSGNNGIINSRYFLFSFSFLRQGVAMKPSLA
jgi:hypothetical protein